MRHEFWKDFYWVEEGAVCWEAIDGLHWVSQSCLLCTSKMNTASAFDCSRYTWAEASLRKLFQCTRSTAVQWITPFDARTCNYVFRSFCCRGCVYSYTRLQPKKICSLRPQIRTALALHLWKRVVLTGFHFNQKYFFSTNVITTHIKG